MLNASQLRRSISRSSNPNLVISCLLSGATSRVEISKLTGLDRPTVTRAVQILKEWELVIETDSKQSDGLGRPRMQLAVNNDSYWLAGVHIGYHSVAVSRVGIGGKIYSRINFLHQRDKTEVLAKILEGITQIQTQTSVPPLGIGVLTGGVISQSTNKIIELPGFGWHNVDLITPLKTTTGLDVSLWPMALGHAQANLLYGLVPHNATFGHLYVGSIVSFALAHKGEVWWGADSAGGRLENLPISSTNGGWGTVQDLISDEGVVAQAQKAGLLGKTESFEDLLKKSSANSPLQNLLDKRASQVGQLVVQLQEVVPIPVMVLSASMVRQNRGIEIAKETVERFCSPNNIPQIISGGEVVEATMRATVAGFISSLLGNHFSRENKND